VKGCPWDLDRMLGKSSIRETYIGFWVVLVESICILTLRPLKAVLCDGCCVEEGKRIKVKEG
ncbi:MAG: hypothetical protein SVK54_00365, partial [candidate division WOR-3 bacterium]|nr:hypothetical protein [candidate division WOR-3 bacterium]